MTMTIRIIRSRRFESFNPNGKKSSASSAAVQRVRQATSPVRPQASDHEAVPGALAAAFAPARTGVAAPAAGLRS